MTIRRLLGFLVTKYCDLLYTQVTQVHGPRKRIMRPNETKITHRICIFNELQIILIKWRFDHLWFLTDPWMKGFLKNYLSPLSRHCTILKMFSSFSLVSSLTCFVGLRKGVQFRGGEPSSVFCFPRVSMCTIMMMSITTSHEYCYHSSQFARHV